MMTSGESRGRILIVAHRDHVPRCVGIAHQLGVKKAFAAAVPLPTQYDRRSAQAWTRSRLAYLLHDILCQLEAYRTEATATVSPSQQLD